jgi:hypothetical protein
VELSHTTLLPRLDTPEFMAHALLDSALQLYVSNRLREKAGQTIQELAKHFKTSEANIHLVLGLLRKEGHVVPFKSKWYLKQERTTRTN